MVESVQTFEGETGPDAPTETPAEAPVVEQVNGTEVPESVLPDKFANVEDLVKSYNELESKLGNASEEPAQTDEPPPEEAKEVLADRGLSFDDMAAEYARDSSLSEARYEELESAGIPRSMVDQYIEGQKAVGERVQQQAFEVVGGEDAYNEMLTWAQASMTESEINSYNRAVQAGDVDDKILAVRGLHSRFTSENGIAPNLRHGNSISGAANDMYDSWAQVTSDMRDTRYKNDPAFRAEVEGRISRSGTLS